ncbi:succinoglycan biosynthesis transport protein ExoP [Agrobacterium pusense]|uniref:GumC family protein n=1 Tax=Agrobacterium pusense TaxID=648995 RepID=UPI00285D85DA|nr:polysaccharide biosynthesis tyrosine autokinase [Agrobacterium pusense]MDR6192727.1 succinoglycan biosynthesis transport protein ExoP [Agrobacterium pusense]
MFDPNRQMASGPMFSPPVPAGPIYYAAPEINYDATHSSGGIDAIGLFLRVLEYRKLVLGVMSACLVVAFFVTLIQTPQYQAVSKLEVVVPSARVFEDLEITAESSDLRAFQTAREKLKSRALAQRVVLALNLSARPDFLFPRKKFSPANLFSRAFGQETSPNTTNLSQDTLMRLATSRVINNLKIDLVPNTSLLTIDYRDQNPEYAREIANQLAQSFIDQRIDQSTNTSLQARQFIQEQVAQVKEKLQESEKALVDYSKAAGITVTGNNESLISSNLADINKALSTAIQENLDYERLVKQIEAGQGGSLEPVLQSQALDKLRGMLAEVKSQYQQKLLLFKPDFPEMKQLYSQMQEIEKQLQLGVLAITDSIKLKHEETIAKVHDLRKKLSELESDQVAYHDKNIKYTILKREVDSNRTQYENLIGKLNEVAVGSELKMQNAAIVDLAVVPGNPYSPSMPVNLAIGFVVSVILIGASIYLLELINNAFSNPDQVEAVLGLSIMGIIPEVDKSVLDEQLADPKSALSEAYLSLRTSLQFSGADGAPGTLLVTSAEPAEGKSTTVIKLAEDFASLGLRILIIDADMRRPSIHRRFHEDNAIGLSNLLTKTVSNEDLPRVIRPTKLPSVFFMSAGTVPPNPADLLSSARMGLIVASLRKRFDMIIIDGPPVIGIADVPILSRLTDATLLMVSSNKVTRNSASMALKRLKAAGANVVGAGMTMFAVGKFDYNYNYAHLHYKYYTYTESTQQLAEPAARGEGKENHVSDKSFHSVISSFQRYFDNIVGRIKSSS